MSHITLITLLVTRNMFVNQIVNRIWHLEPFTCKYPAFTKWGREGCLFLLGGKKEKGDRRILSPSRLTRVKGKNKRKKKYFSNFHWSGTSNEFSSLPLLQTNRPLSPFPFLSLLCFLQANVSLTDNGLEHIKVGDQMVLNIWINFSR